MKPKSRQRKYQLEHKANGLCVSCPEPLAEGSKSYCVDCLKAKRKRDRKLTGYKPWKRGGKGRPPLSAKKRK